MKVIVILGPTGVGKTKMSVELAKRLNGEIINGDSTQVYRELDIATAKITEAEKENIPHHLFDICDIGEDYSVYDYQRDARIKINELISMGKTPIIVGGTGLYIKAALYDYQFSNDEVINEFEDLSDDELYDLLLSVDKDTTIHKNNRKRVVRAYNYYLSNGVPYSLKEKTEELLYDALFIGLTTDRDELYKKINNRVDIMMNNGLLDEAKKIYERNIRSKAVMTPIGYKELFDYFDSLISLDEALEQIKQHSRKYAKRQYTFFNNQLNVDWFNVDYDCFDNTINEVINFINRTK